MSLTDAHAHLDFDDYRGDLAGSHGLLRLPKTSIAFDSPLLGEFNLENMLVAACCSSRWSR